MSKEDLRNMNVAIVGCGWMADTHIRVWNKLTKGHVVAVCDINERAAMLIARKWRIPFYYTDPSDMLRQQNISIFSICTPPQTHTPLVIQAIESGVHVLVEKPLAVRVKEADTIMDRLRANKVKISVVHNWLFIPVMQRVLARVKEMSADEIVSADINVLETPDDPMTANPHHWSHALPGGRLGEMLVHPIYLLQAVLGELKVTNVMARKVGRYPWISSDELRVVFDSKGRTSAIYVSLNSPRHAILMSVYSKNYVLKADLIGQSLVILKRRNISEPSLSVDHVRQAHQLMWSALSINVHKVMASALRRYKSPHEIIALSLLNAVMFGGKPLVSVNEAYGTVELLEQVCQAVDAQTRQV